MLTGGSWLDGVWDEAHASPPLGGPAPGQWVRVTHLAASSAVSSPAIATPPGY